MKTDTLDKYLYCINCDKELDASQIKRALRLFEQQSCSIECLQQNYKRRNTCCDKAELLNCFCAIAYKCPVHGETHKGTHD